MDIWTVLKACVRRWYVFLPILGIALWIGNARVEAMPPVYSAESSAALTGPALVPGDEAGEIIEVNPFQSLGGSLTTTTQILVSVMDSGPKRDQFAEQGITLDYEVSRDEAVIYFYVEGTDPDAVVATSARLIELLDVEIATLQSKPVETPESRIRAVPLTQPLSAVRDSGAGLQLLAVFGIIGLLLATAAAVALDGFARHRGQRATGHGAEVRATRRRVRVAATTEHSEESADSPPDASPDTPADVSRTGAADVSPEVPADERGDAAGEPDPTPPVPAPAGRHGLPS